MWDEPVPDIFIYELVLSLLSHRALLTPDLILTEKG
jgi:hypothetical protein